MKQPVAISTERRSPALAFVLSAVFPGAGHWYVGLRGIAAWTAGFYLLLGAMLAMGSQWNLPLAVGNAIFGLPALSLFAIFDAPAAARAWNAGSTAELARRNPRVACLLNFLTKGFGYFYLGEQAKGVAFFAALLAVEAIAAARFHPGVGFLVAMLAVELAMAADGWRLGRRKLLAAGVGPFPEAKAGMPRWLPAACGAVIVAAWATGLGVLTLPGATRRDAFLRAPGSTTTFVDATDGFELPVPPGMVARRGGPGPLAVTLSNGHPPACWASVLAQPTWMSPHDYLMGVERGFAFQPGVAGARLTQDTLGGVPAEKLYVGLKPEAREDALMLDYFATKRGWRLVALVEANPQNCFLPMQALERGFRFLR